MYKGKRKMKALAVMCTALALGATSAGAMFSGSVWNDNAIIASASESVTFSAESFGFGADTQIKGFNLVKGISLVGSYTAEQFRKGITADVTEGTEARIFFDDGMVSYSATTGEVLKNTRKSGVTRETFTIDFKTALENHNGYYFSLGKEEKIAEISVCAVSKGKGEKGSIKYYKNDFTIDSFFPNGLDEQTCIYGAYLSGLKFDKEGKVFTSDEIYLNDNKLTFDYEEDSDILVTVTQHHQGSSGMNLSPILYRFDTSTNKLVKISENFVDFGYALNSGNFAEMEQGNFESIEISTKYGTINSMVNDIGTYYDENKKAIFTADEIKNNDFDIIINQIGINPFKTDIGNIATVTFNFADGGKTAYKYLPYGNIKIADTRKGVIAKKPSGEGVATATGSEVFSAVDEETGDIVISAKTIGHRDEENQACYIGLYEGCEFVSYITLGDYNLDGYRIQNYNPKKNYYVRIGVWDKVDEHDRGILLWYKYNPTLKAWVKTVDTREKDTYTINVDGAMFPEAVNLEENSGTVLKGSKKVLDFADGDITRDDKRTTFQLTYDGLQDKIKDEEYEVHIGNLRYVFCGINAELVSGTTEQGYLLGSEKDVVKVPVDFANGDGNMHDFTVNGKTEEGKDYFGTFTADNTADIEIHLPDGEYDIIRDDGQYEHVVIDRDDSEKIKGSIGDKNSGDSESGSYNSDGDRVFKDNDGNEVVVGEVVEAEFPTFTLEPYTYKCYSVEKPDGSEKISGEIKGDSFETLADIDKALPEAVYYNYETQEGIINAKEGIVKEEGYLTVEDKGTLNKFNLEKGDINLDGKIRISDLVLAQKYLLNNLDKETTFGIKNYIAMDMCIDESADVFDMVELRKIVADSVG